MKDEKIDKNRKMNNYIMEIKARVVRILILIGSSYLIVWLYYLAIGISSVIPLMVFTIIYILLFGITIKTYRDIKIEYDKNGVKYGRTKNKVRKR